MWKNALLACLCAILVVWWWAQRFGERPPQNTDDSAPTLSLHQVSSYRYDAHGARLDTLQADAVNYHHDSGDTHFTRPILRRETAQGHLYADADNGLLAADDTITLNGNARMQRFAGDLAEITVKSALLHYNPHTQTLSTPQEVAIDTPDSHTLSLGAVWQLERNYLILEQNVRSHYEPRR